MRDATIPGYGSARRYQVGAAKREPLRGVHRVPLVVSAQHGWVCYLAYIGSINNSGFK